MSISFKIFLASRAFIYVGNPDYLSLGETYFQSLTRLDGFGMIQ